MKEVGGMASESDRLPVGKIGRRPLGGGGAPLAQSEKGPRKAARRGRGRDTAVSRG